VALRPNERVALFIDGPNLYHSSKALGFEVDYGALLKFVNKQVNLVRAYYYTSIIEHEEYSPIKPLTDWLSYNGFTTVIKPAKEYVDAAGRTRIKGNMDIELAIDLLELAPKIDHALLFTGDADLRRLVEAVQRKGVRVSVVSSLRTNPALVADELRRQADHFVDLVDIAQDITRKPIDSRGRATISYGKLPAKTISAGK
jgi:uncharacterized LabA/DUF88 family protein